MLVFLNFFLDEEKDTHWFRMLERRLAHLANVPAMSVFITLIALLIMDFQVEEAKRLDVILAGIWGIVIYIGVQVLSHMLGGEPEVDEEGNAVRHDAEGVPTGGESRLWWFPLPRSTRCIFQFRRGNRGLCDYI